MRDKLPIEASSICGLSKALCKYFKFTNSYEFAIFEVEFRSYYIYASSTLRSLLTILSS